MYPASGTGGNKELTDKWTWDFFLTAAEKCQKAGHPFGLALGQTGDTANWLGALFNAYGAQLVDKDGNTTVKSEPVKQVLDYMKRLVPFLPPDSRLGRFLEQQGADLGQAALIFNPPSAWAVAGARCAESRRAVLAFLVAQGPKGRFDPAQPSFWASGNSRRTRRQRRAWRFTCGKKSRSSNWSPPATATYPVLWDVAPVQDLGRGRPAQGRHLELPPRGEVIESVSGSPAPANIANQIYSQATMAKMVAQCTQSGKTIDQAIDWAASELEGFKRT